MFQDVGLSVCALKRYDDRFFYLDLTSNQEQVDFLQWINQKSKKPVDLLDHEGRQISNEIQTSMFLAFIDFNNPDPQVVKDSQHAL